jgi:hypothetical protein
LPPFPDIYPAPLPTVAATQTALDNFSAGAAGPSNWSSPVSLIAV